MANRQLHSKDYDFSSFYDKKDTIFIDHFKEIIDRLADF